MRPDRIDAMVAGHPVVGIEGGQELEAGLGAADHGHRDGLVEGDHRVRRDRRQQLVQGQDLAPVGVLGGGRLVMDRRDRRLDLVRPEPGMGQGIGDEGHALGDARRIPERAVLLGQRDEAAVGAGPGAASRIGQEHQCQQPGHLAVLGEQPVQVAREPDRLAGQLGSLQVRPGGRGVALVEHEIQDVEHDPESIGALRLGRQGEPGPGPLDAGLGSADPLGHRRFRDKERVGDLGGRQPTHGPQRERDL